MTTPVSSTPGANSLAEALAALRGSEARFRTIFDGVNEAIFIHNPDDGSLWDVNKTTCDLYGYSKEEILRLTVQDLSSGTPPHTQAEAKAWMDKARRGPVPPFEWLARDRQGRTFWIEVNLRLIHLNGQERLLATARDIQERKRAERERQKLARQMQEAQKLESLGVLAGGVAHEFNNLLMTILGHADLALQDLPESSSSKESVIEIEKAARLAAGLSRQMLAYSGRGSFLVEKLDLRELLREMKPLLEASVAKKTVLRIPLGADPIWVKTDPAQMRQVILNLILNASEAIGDKDGVVTVSAGVTQCSREFFSQTYLPDELPAGIYAILEVADTGCGIQKQNLSRIFDPFFTTKFTGRGLGLPVVLGILRGHKGAIQVESAAGQGSVFRICLPVAVDPAEARSLSPANMAPCAQNTGTILLVDDEPAIRALGRKMLGRLGYKPLLAADGREAIEIYRQRQAEIDGIVLDLTMPHMAGEEAFAELKRLNSNARIILASGYNAQEATRGFAGKNLVGFLQKPFQLEDLALALRQALGK